MSDKKHAAHIAFVLLICCLLIVYSIFRINEHINIESLQNQISNGFQVVYVDSSYIFSFGNLIFAPILACYFVSHFIFKSSIISIKWVGSAAVLAFIIMIPGRIWEFGRLQNIAENNGYTVCPPFTIASSASTVRAMVKETRYCSDREINRLGQGGHYHELEIIDKYLQSKEEESHPLSSAR